MLGVFESILPVFAIIVLGFLLRRFNFVEASKWQVVDELCFWILFPSLLASTLINTDLSTIEFDKILMVLMGMIITISALMLALYPFFRNVMQLRRPQYTTLFQTVTRWHGFIAMALVLKFFGEPGLAVIAVAFVALVPALQLVNVTVLSVFSEEYKFSYFNVLKQISRNPILWGCVVGMVVNFANIPVWDPVLTFLDLLGRAALGISLLALGAGLSLRAALKPSPVVGVAVAGKLILVPLIMFGFAVLFGVTGDALVILMISAGVPTAMNGYVLAKKMGGDAELYASIATVQTAVSFFTLPLIILLARWWVGA
jgi:predicted permease